MKVLIITYYWVPAGGSGIQRWLKFVKYLREFDIEPIIYTVENASYPIIDETLQKDVPDGIAVIRNPIWEPNDILSRLKGKETKTSAGFLNPNPSTVGKMLQYIRANYFIPDARRFWIKPSVKKLEKYLKKNTIDAIITTGPPHSLHLIGLQLKQKLGIKWIADFRDPWTDIDYFHQLPLTKSSKRKHQQLEASVLQQANMNIVVGKTMQENFLKITENVKVISNGFDNSESTKDVINLDTTFSITHIGLMNADRNPKALWKALAELTNEHPHFAKDLEIKLIGKIADEVNQELVKYKFTNVTKIDYVPHIEVEAYQRKSQVLLLAINKVPSAKGIITGKIFEYLQAKRPILAIGPENGDLATILEQTNSGTIVGFEDAKQLKKVVLDLYQQFKSGSLQINSTGIEKFHRKQLTAQLADVLKQVVNS